MKMEKIDEIKELRETLDGMIFDHAKEENGLRNQIDTLTKDAFKNVLYPKIKSLIGKYVKHVGYNYIKFSRIDDVTYDNVDSTIHINRVSFRVDTGNYKNDMDKSLSISKYYDFYNVRNYECLSNLIDSIEEISKDEFNNEYLKLMEEFEKIVIGKYVWKEIKITEKSKN
jgi:hypothetical protein